MQTTATDGVPFGWERTEWNTINWRCALRNIRNLRRRTFRAIQAGHWTTVNGLQKLMLPSYCSTGRELWAPSVALLLDPFAEHESMTVGRSQPHLPPTPWLVRQGFQDFGPL